MKNNTNDFAPVQSAFPAYGELAFLRAKIGETQDRINDLMPYSAARRKHHLRTIEDATNGHFHPDHGLVTGTRVSNKLADTRRDEYCKNFEMDSFEEVEAEINQAISDLGFLRAQETKLAQTFAQWKSELYAIAKERQEHSDMNYRRSVRSGTVKHLFRWEVKFTEKDGRMEAVVHSVDILRVDKIHRN